MAFNYVVSAQRPTAVTHAVVGNFTSAADTNLLVAKCTRFEIHLLTPEGLQPILDANVYGRISAFTLFRPANMHKDLLFIATERFRFCVLEFDERTNELITRANGATHDLVGRPSPNGQIGVIDPTASMVALSLYVGLLKIVPIDADGVMSEAFNVRIDELNLIDMVFLHGETHPTLALLYMEPNEARSVRTYVLQKGELVPGPFEQLNVDPSASMLVPVPAPHGGVLIVGESSVSYRSVTHSGSTMMPPTLVRACGRIDADGSRFLVGDYEGVLSVLALRFDDSGPSALAAAVAAAAAAAAASTSSAPGTLPGAAAASATGGSVTLVLERLGETSVSSALCYLDNGVVYVGSLSGDSQLIKLHSEPDDSQSYVEVLAQFTNLGPILDLAVVDVENHGQSQLVTCSGLHKDGSLRVIRNGIGIQEIAELDLASVTGLWSLKDEASPAWDKYVVVSFVSESVVLAVSDSTLEQFELPGFVTNEATLFCANVGHGRYVHITATAARLMSIESGLVASWSPSDNGSITVATANSKQILLGCGQGNLYYFELHDGQTALNVKTHAKLEDEISCVALGSVRPESANGLAECCAVGLWSISASVFSLPTLQQMHSEPLGGCILPRSILFATFEGITYLMCALGDGHFFNFVFDWHTGGLTERKKLSLGTQPIMLIPFETGEKSGVFACSDRPTVIYSSSKKLVYSNVNVKEVTFVCPFNAEDFPNSLAIAQPQSVTFGTIDDIQKLHIRTVPIGEMPRRIVYQPETRTFAVCTQTLSLDRNTGTETDSCFVRVFDALTFEVLASFSLDNLEVGMSMTSCSFTGDSAAYFVVGTSFVIEPEPESSKGRILVLRYDNKQLSLVFEREVSGAVTCLRPINGALVAAVNSHVLLYRWNANEAELDLECRYRGHVLVVRLAVRGDFVLVSDLMRACTLLLYRPDDGRFEEISRDVRPLWLVDSEFLDDDHYLSAENSFNFVCTSKSSSASDEDRSRLVPAGAFHVGDMVNQLRHGSLAMNVPGIERSVDPTLLFGTLHGAIGVVARMNETEFEFFSRLEAKLADMIRGVGGLPHEEWRTFTNERRPIERSGFVDGDLIEAFLDLSRDKMEQLASAMDVPVDDLCRRVEDLSRIH